MPDAAQQPAPSPVSSGRRALVYAGLVLLLVPSAWDTVTHREHWPFSSYRMFSKTREEARVEHHAVVALPADGSASFPLFRAEEIHPFHWYRHQKGFRLMLRQPDGEARVRAGLADVLARYERNRVEGRHDGPALRGVQLYRVDYALDPEDPDLVRHEERRLIAEVMAGDRKGGG